MQDVNLLAPPPGDAPTMDSLEFQDIAHTTPSRKSQINIPSTPLALCFRLSLCVAHCGVVVSCAAQCTT